MIDWIDKNIITLITELTNNYSNLELILFLIMLFPILLFWGTTIFNFLFSSNYLSYFSASNLDTTKSEFAKKSKNLPLVSVLIPARNEEKNIKNLIISLSNQNYPNFEVIILDDNSTDKTNKIAVDLIKEQKLDNFRIVKGERLPANWLGKNWACFQLSKLAKGEILIFTDADDLHRDNAINNTVNALKSQKVDFLSAFPEQVTITFWEKVITPFIDLILYSLLPIKLVKWTNFTSLSAANGQWIAITKSAYEITGGHNSLKNKVVEDVEFCKLIKSKKLKALLLNGKDVVFTRMYSNLDEIINGFNKNFFGLTNNSYVIFSIIVIMISLVGIFPFLYFLIFWNKLSLILLLLLLIWQILLVLMLYKLRLRKMLFEIIFQFITLPLKMTMAIYIGVKSMISNKNGNINWKDRKIEI